MKKIILLLIGLAVMPVSASEKNKNTKWVLPAVLATALVAYKGYYYLYPNSSAVAEQENPQTAASHDENKLPQADDKPELDNSYNKNREKNTNTAPHSFSKEKNNETRVKGINNTPTKPPVFTPTEKKYNTCQLTAHLNQEESSYAEKVCAIGWDY